MTSTNSRNAVRSQRSERHNIAAPFATWLNAKGVHVIEWPKAKDPKVEGRASKLDARLARADAFARELLRPLVELTVIVRKELKEQKTRRRRAYILARYSPQIARILRRIREDYPTGPNLNEFSASMGDLEYRYSSLRDDAKAAAVNSRLEQFLWLDEEGVFDQFRRCALPECAKYFYSLRPEGIYCSGRCQRTHYKRSDEYKEKNREYQRNYYRDFLSVRAKRKELRHGQTTRSKLPELSTMARPRPR
jgi:hypothetical protein